jgi:hypothetical protein
MGKQLLDTFHTQNCLQQGDSLSPSLFTFALAYPWATEIE